MDGFETVEERVRNVVSPMYNLAYLIKFIQELPDEKIICFIKNNNLSDIIIERCEYLIKISNIIDKHLPKEFSINDIIEK